METIKSGSLAGTITGVLLLLVVLAALSFSGATYAGLPKKEKLQQMIVAAEKRRKVTTANTPKQAPKSATQQKEAPQKEAPQKEAPNPPMAVSTTNNDGTIPPQNEEIRKKFEDYRDEFKKDFDMDDDVTVEVEEDVDPNAQDSEGKDRDDTANSDTESKYEKGTLFDEAFINKIGIKNFSNPDARRFTKGSYTEKLGKAFVHAYNLLPPVGAENEGWKDKQVTDPDAASAVGMLSADAFAVGGRVHPAIDGNTFKHYPIVTGSIDDVNSGARFISLKVKVLERKTVCGKSEDFDGYFSVSLVNSGGQPGGWGVFISTYGLPDGQEADLIGQCFGQSHKTPFAQGSGYDTPQFAGTHGKWSTEAIALLIATGKAEWKGKKLKLALPEDGYEKLKKYLDTRTSINSLLTDQEFQIEAE
ncbi:hypothetical protein [Sansalvadorimonas verongulae]|uniref:hypothetical protein n=1 Tax=Sansalvadorimonas verongulae TaxID=2172824 RepID=UPI0012BD0D32|nr:hypothetical protein [Sansalvadorimonas verongulae]MTI12161.1 hypothetical protein [Sansalvadorimonas verongulae]